MIYVNNSAQNPCSGHFERYVDVTTVWDSDSSLNG